MYIGFFFALGGVERSGEERLCYNFEFFGWLVGLLFSSVLGLGRIRNWERENRRYCGISWRVWFDLM